MSTNEMTKKEQMRRKWKKNKKSI